MSLALCGIILLLVYRTDIMIAYHRCAKMRAWKKATGGGPGGSIDEVYLQAHERHRAALVKYGFLERRVFALKHISVPSVASRRLWQELSRAFPEDIDARMQGYEPETKDAITVWDRPSNLAAWAAIINAHDQPPTNAAHQTVVGDARSVLPFVGTWTDEEGNVVVRISCESDSPVKIETTSDLTWQVVVKNVRRDGLRLMFDQYLYARPRDERKLPIGVSGERRFDGFRCRTVLALDPDDSKRMTYTLSTPLTPDAVRLRLRRIDPLDGGG